MQPADLHELEILVPRRGELHADIGLQTQNIHWRHRAVHIDHQLGKRALEFDQPRRHPECAQTFGDGEFHAALDCRLRLVARANDTEYGLAAGVWTRDVASANRLAGLLDAGSVYINCWGVGDPGAPFGGFKSSGIGREHGREGLEAYLETKTIWTSLASAEFSVAGRCSSSRCLRPGTPIRHFGHATGPSRCTGTGGEIRIHSIVLDCGDTQIEYED